MRKVLLLLSIIFNCSVLVQAQNLILNASCDDSLVNGNIPYWQEIVGTGWTKRCNSPNAFAGLCYFYPGAVATGELQQSIDLSMDSIAIDSGNKNYYFTGYVLSYGQAPSDESNIYLNFYDSVDTLLISYLLGPFNQTVAWLRLDSVLLAPQGSRKVIVKLRSIRRNGSNNDGYYDELYLGNTPISGISELKSNAIISIFPNPSNGELNITLNKKPYAKAQLAIADLLGRKILEMENVSMETNLVLNQPQGIYLVTISTDTEIYTKRIIIDH